jgi:hypothetical protein
MAQNEVGGQVFDLVMLVDTNGTPISPSTGVADDRELVVTTYVCKTAFVGASVGDTITLTQVLDVSATPTSVASVWRNQTTALDLLPAPSSANLELVGSSAITDAQLRATPVPVSGSFYQATQPVSGPITDAQLRSAAVPVSASGGFGGSSATIDTNNTTSVALAANASFTGTATDISLFAQINFTLLGVPSSAKGSLFFEFSVDGVNWDISVPNFVRNPSLFIPIPLVPVGKFFRVRYVNDGGAFAITALGIDAVAGTPAAMSTLRLTTYLLTNATTGLARTLDQSVSNGDPIILTRSIISGITPDNIYADSAVSGILSSNTSAVQLAALAVFTGQFKSTTAFAGAAINITTNRDGTLFLDWGLDGVSSIIVDSYPVLAGVPLPLFVPMKTSYLRVRYANGSAGATTTFNLQTIFKNPPASATYTQVNQPVNQGDLVQKVVSIPIDGVRNSYMASISNLDTAATPTDIFTIQGSATKTIRITRLAISGDSSSNDRLNVDLLRRSSANTGGTSSVLTNVKNDSLNPSATAVVRAYTANPTLGTLVGLMDSQVLLFPSTAGNVPTEYTWEFGTRAAQGIVLRGTSEQIAINLGGAAVGTTTAISICVEWVEEQI